MWCSKHNTDSKSAVNCFIASSISPIYYTSNCAKGSSNAAIAFSLLMTSCLFCIRRLWIRLRSVFFSVAFDSRCTALRLFSPSKLLVALIASSFSLIVVPNFKVSLEGECFAGRDQMMEGTPLPPFLVAIFGSRR